MDEFNLDRDEVIKRAKDAGIEAIITIGSDLKGNIGGLELSKKYDFIYSSVGFHPHGAKDFTEDIFNQIKEWATPPHPPLDKATSSCTPLDKDTPPQLPPLLRGGWGVRWLP